MPSSACPDCDIDEGCADDCDWSILRESGWFSEGGYDTDISCDYDTESERCEEESVSGDDAARFISQGGYYSDRSDVLTEAEDEGEGVTYASGGGDLDDESDWGLEDPVLDAAVRVSARQFPFFIFRRPSRGSKPGLLLIIIECCSVRKALRLAGLFWNSGTSAGSTESYDAFAFGNLTRPQISASHPRKEYQPSCDFCFPANNSGMRYGPSAVQQA
jgi:hypothetical protein